MPPAVLLSATSLLTALSAPRWETGTWMNRKSNGTRARSRVRFDDKLIQYKSSFLAVSYELESMGKKGGEEILRLTKNLWQKEQRQRRLHLVIASQPHATTVRLQTMSIDLICYQSARKASGVTNGATHLATSRVLCRSSAVMLSGSFLRISTKSSSTAYTQYSM